MVIGRRLRELRESQHLSQGDIERRCGLLHCYTSRVENGLTVPTIETLGKYAKALRVPLYKLFYKGKELPKRLRPPSAEKGESILAIRGKEGLAFRRLAGLLGRMDERRRRLLLAMAQQMAGRKRAY